MGKAWDWLHDDDDHPIHHESWPWDEIDDEEIEDDESYAAEDYISSRPWGDDNNG